MLLNRLRLVSFAAPATALVALLAPSMALADSHPEVVTAPSVAQPVIAGRAASCDGAVFAGPNLGPISYAWFKTGVGQVGSEQTYVPSRDDIGWDLSCRASVSNGAGTAEASSEQVSVVDGSPSPEQAPRITGKATPGVVASCSTGTWTGEGNSYAYSWLLNDTPIAGATNARLLLLDRFVDKTVACRVTATNQSGSQSRDSTAIVPFNPPILAPLTRIQPRLPKLRTAIAQGITNRLACNATCATQSHAFILASDAARLGIRGRNLGGVIVVGTGKATRTFKGQLVVKTVFTASAKRGLAKARSQRIDLLFETSGGTRYSHRKYHVAVSRSVTLRR